MAPELWPVAEQMVATAGRYDLDLAAKHIPGVENDLSDGLSRFVRRKNYSDWQYRRDEFESLCSLVEHPFTLDAGADPVGTNAHLPRNCSLVESYLKRCVEGEKIYGNPDFDLIGEYLEHFLRAQLAAPATTAGTFVLPMWDTYSWWPLLKGARVLKFYPRHSHLFTSPAWRSLTQGDGTYAFGEERAYRGPTQWPVLVVHFPPTWRAGEALQQLRHLVELLAAETGRPCQYCPGTRHGTVCCCVACSRLLCQACGGVGVGLTGLIQCSRCLARSAGIVTWMTRKKSSHVDDAQEVLSCG
ncbi:hypothetical protein CYMTET_48362 [Cymbomonas tetramitiformis]|uniref:Uncharacterized protein n=1 Tax=Cymbomonas tetramitiformis TaxID=36881 RepID=A0AAE0BSF6_9CHLO|nr:hypothetical protein CYMTET_48362 [Cymbomonas tetramitiformis]